MARLILAEVPGSIYLDLERTADLRKLTDPELYLAHHPNQLVCLDEIQRAPELFPALRGILDERRRPGQLLLLGSASRDLIRQSSETLAGRIGYLELTPFLASEVVGSKDEDPLARLWLRGGFPPSYLATSDDASVEWREQFIRTFLERDLPQLGVGTPAPTLRRRRGPGAKPSCSSGPGRMGGCRKRLMGASGKGWPS